MATDERPLVDILRELKDQSGLSWAGLSDMLGASSGDFVRKVASGARPGRNIEPNVRELYNMGAVSRPVERRRTKSGKVAKVRGTKDAGSYTPSENQLRAPAEAREMFRTAKDRLGWKKATGSPDSPENDFVATVRSAGRGRRRVKFRAHVRMANGSLKWVEVGSKSGYRPRDVLAGVRALGGSVTEWVMTQTANRKYELQGGQILDVEVIAE